MTSLYPLLVCLLLPGEPAVEADVVIRGATLYDGSGAAGVVGDLAVRGERIVAVGASPSPASRAFSTARGWWLRRASSTCTRTAIIR